MYVFGSVSLVVLAVAAALAAPPATPGLFPPELCPVGAPTAAPGSAEFIPPRTARSRPPSPQPGDLVVSEFMSNPTAVPDAQGEWIELQNTLPWRLDMEGLVISDAGGDLFGLWNGGQGILVGPGSSLVLGNNPDPATNGGVRVDFAYSGFVLANVADEIYVHTREGVLLDAVEYSTSEAWPLEAGRSASLDPRASDPLLNDDPDQWCPATAPLPGGDSGSPGAANGVCQ